jgi:16S rRNA (cytidine1402-2'-O)-methyltransferase
VDNDKMGTLYMVATPIGHLRDITLRALDTLKEVDLILCEDTRVTRTLTSRHGIQKPLQSFFAGNEERRLGPVLERLRGGESVALVTDAGTPGVSDPGYLLVRACREEGIPVVPIPGASALASALSVSGLPSQRVLFLGFPPRKAGERARFLATLREDPATLVFYEAPHRIRAFLKEALSALPGRECVAARELTKKFESVAPVTDPERVPERGEFVVMFGPPAEPERRALKPEDAAGHVRALVESGVEEKEALRQVAREMGVPKREVYNIVKGKRS